MINRNTIFSFFLFFFLPFISYADHIFGGYIGLKTVDVENRKYLLTLNVYIDVPRFPTGLSEFQNYAVKVNIFRKKDNQIMDKFFIAYRSHKSVVFENAACAVQRNFEIVQIYLDYEVNLDPTRYTDSGGYYMVYDQCCRNKDLDNILLPGETSTLFYTEFPALYQNNVVIDYSTPVFPILNGDYICLNRTFNYKFAATDLEGDELKYSLGAPFAGRGVPGNPVPDPTAGPYNYVNWATGYSNALPITGNPSLSVNSTTGNISIKANKEGLYLFSVVCEDYRDGKRMGMVKHDFQLPVVTCNYTTPSVPIVKHNGLESSEVDYCPGETIILETQFNSIWAFQWQKNGLNIEGATNNTYQATEKATYQVIKSLKGICANDTISNIVNLKSAVEKPSIVASSLNICGSSDLTLKVSNPSSSLKYYWIFNSTQLGIGDSINVSNPGWYYLQGDKPSGNCKSDKDSIEVTKTLTNPLPEPLSAYEACIGESIKLETLVSSGYSYQWKKDNAILSNEVQSSLIVKQGGEYIVEVKDQNNCVGISKTYFVKFTAEPSIIFDNIGPLCLYSNNVGILFAQPTGGTFSGNGVKNNLFDPLKAGLGVHDISYNYTSLSGCKGSSTIKIEVKKPFDLEVSPPMAVIEAGDSIRIELKSNESNLAVHWHPDDFLTDHNAFVQNLKPDKSIEYTIVAIDMDGCKVTKYLKIDVSDFAKLIIPTAFSPNGDLVNDKFELFGDSFKSFLFKIFDRWGAVVFETTDKDNFWNGGLGNDKSKPLPAGMYSYKVKGESLKGLKLNKSGNILLLK